MLKLGPVQGYPPSPACAALERWSRNTTSMRGGVAVAYSGGADSTCLLIEEARLRAGVMAPGHDGSTRAVLHAFHVHHGLQPAADDFEAHATSFCQALALQWPTALSSVRVNVALPPGASVEAQARDARYDALADMAVEHGVATVLLAQHADDQVETMLIALCRGAGVAGLAGMPEEFEHRGIRFARPLLDVSGSSMRSWLAHCRIPFVEDPSNADERHARNRLRRRVMPALEAASPSFRSTFARSARLMHAAQTLIDELAHEDLERVGTPPVIRRLQALGEARQANVLRLWLRAQHRTTGSEAQILELVRVVARCTTRGHAIHLRVGRGHVERAGDVLCFRPSAS